jgi:hypothetical protein
MWPEKSGSNWNGIKLSSNRLLYQSVTCDATRLHKERVRLGPAFDGAGLDAVRAVGLDHQRGSEGPRTHGATPAQGIDEAEALQGDALPLCRYQPDDAVQVRDQGQDGLRLEAPDEAWTVKHLQAPRLLAVPQLGLALSASLVQCGQSGGGRPGDRQEGGAPRHRLCPKTRLGHTGAQCTHAEHRWEGGTQLGCHPGGRMDGQAHGFHPLDALIGAPQLAEPAGVRQPLLRRPRRGCGMGARGRDIPHWLLMQAADGMDALRVEAGEVGQGAKRSSAYEHVPRPQGGRERSHLGSVVGRPGGRKHLQQAAGPGMQQGEPGGPGAPTPRTRPTRVASGGRQALRDQRG